MSEELNELRKVLSNDEAANRATVEAKRITAKTFSETPLKPDQDGHAGIMFQSAVSGLWYSDPFAAGTIMAIKVGDKTTRALLGNELSEDMQTAESELTSLRDQVRKLTEENTDLRDAWERILATHRVRGMSYVESARALVMQLTSAKQQIEELTRERDEADRRAGCAERLRDEAQGRITKRALGEQELLQRIGMPGCAYGAAVEILAARNAELEKERDEAREIVSSLHSCATDGGHIHTLLKDERACATDAIIASRNRIAELESEAARLREDGWQSTPEIEESGYWWVAYRYDQDSWKVMAVYVSGEWPDVFVHVPGERGNWLGQIMRFSPVRWMPLKCPENPAIDAAMSERDGK